jgi:hypothetical protein
MAGNAIDRERVSISAHEHRPSGAVLDRPHPLHRRPALRNSSSGATHLANSDSARAGSGTGAKDKHGLIDPAQLLMADALEDQWKRAHLFCNAQQSPEACARAICVEEQSEAKPRSEAQSHWRRPGNSRQVQGIPAKSRELWRIKKGTSVTRVPFCVLTGVVTGHGG